MPNHIPRTFRRPPRDGAEVVELLGSAGLIDGLSAVVLDASIVLDNGVSGEFAATPP
jgi:hypothetical protein